MGVSFGQFTAKVRSLQTALDPAGAALKTYRSEVRLLQEAYKLGAVSQDQFKAGMQSAVTSYRQSSATVAGVNRQSRGGLQNLGFQLNDVAVQFAGGTRAAIIFAQQGPQIVQAVQMMAGGTSKFATFMGGPWGVAIGLGVSVLGVLAAKMFETDDASKKLKDSTLSLNDALRKHALASDAARKAIDDYNAAQKQERDNAEGLIKINLGLAEADIKRAKAKRELLAALLKEQEA